jgi:hypothetical protein
MIQYISGAERHRHHFPGLKRLRKKSLCGRKIAPQGLKPSYFWALTAQLKLCPFKTARLFSGTYGTGKAVLLQNNKFLQAVKPGLSPPPPSTSREE